MATPLSAVRMTLDWSFLSSLEFFEVKAINTAKMLCVAKKNLMHMSETLFKLDFTLGYKNMTIKLCTTICGADNESETNVVRRINACKKNLLALVLVHSTVFALMNFQRLLICSLAVTFHFCQGWLKGKIPRDGDLLYLVVVV